MTCIVAVAEKGTIYMGGDSLMSSESSKTISRTPKVFQRGDLLFGTCKSVRMRNLLRYCLVIPDYHGDDPMAYLVNDFIEAVRSCFKMGGFGKEEEGRETGGRFLVGFQGELYCINDEYAVCTPADPYFAIGCADEIAFGSLHSTMQLQLDPLRRLEMALQAATRHNTNVCEPFTFLTSQPGENT